MLSVPSIPMTGTGMRNFIHEMEQLIIPTDDECKGYSIVTDPSGRLAVSANVLTTDKGKRYSIAIDIRPATD